VLKNLNIYEQQQTAINFRIQGTGGDMKELAIAVLQLTEFNEDVCMRGTCTTRCSCM